MGKTLQALVRMVSNDSAHHARIQALMEELHGEFEDARVDNGISLATKATPPSSAQPSSAARSRFVEIDEPPQVTGQLVGPVAGLAISATTSSINELNGEEDVEDGEVVAPPAVNPPIRQSSCPPSHQGSAPSQPARVRGTPNPPAEPRRPAEPTHRLSRLDAHQHLSTAPPSPPTSHRRCPSLLPVNQLTTPTPTGTNRSTVTTGLYVPPHLWTLRP